MKVSILSALLFLSFDAAVAQDAICDDSFHVSVCDEAPARPDRSCDVEMGSDGLGLSAIRSHSERVGPEFDRLKQIYLGMIDEIDSAYVNDEVKLALRNRMQAMTTDSELCNQDYELMLEFQPNAYYSSSENKVSICPCALSRMNDAQVRVHLAIEMGRALSFCGLSYDDRFKDMEIDDYVDAYPFKSTHSCMKGKLKILKDPGSWREFWQFAIAKIFSGDPAIDHQNINNRACRIKHPNNALANNFGAEAIARYMASHQRSATREQRRDYMSSYISANCHGSEASLRRDEIDMVWMANPNFREQIGCSREPRVPICSVSTLMRVNASDSGKPRGTIPGQGVGN